MTLASRIATAFWMSSVVVFMACGGSSTSQGTPNGFGSSSSGGYNSPDSTTTGGDDASGYSSSSSSSGGSSDNDTGACMAQCSVDSDCQSACPTAPSGYTNCCAGGACYMFLGSACQDVPEAGTEE
jgi:hypothetical protein